MSESAGPIVDALTPGDLARCVEIETELFTEDSPWSLRAFVSELRAPYNTYFAVRDALGGPALGYAGISVLGRPGEHECEVHTIAVEPGHQGGGYGRALLAALLRVADEARATVFLEVRTDNETAIALYRRNGFEVAGTRRNYYQPSGADAYTMVRAARSDQPEGHANS